MTRAPFSDFWGTWPNHPTTPRRSIQDAPRTEQRPKTKHAKPNRGTHPTKSNHTPGGTRAPSTERTPSQPTNAPKWSQWPVPQKPQLDECQGGETAITHSRHPQRGRSDAGLVDGRTRQAPTESPAHIPTQPVRKNIYTNPRPRLYVPKKTGQVCVRALLSAAKRNVRNVRYPHAMQPRRANQVCTDPVPRSLLREAGTLRGDI